jgi:hypothetical protein
MTINSSGEPIDFSTWSDKEVIDECLDIEEGLRESTIRFLDSVAKKYEERGKLSINQRVTCICIIKEHASREH